MALTVRFGSESGDLVHHRFNQQEIGLRTGQNRAQDANGLVRVTLPCHRTLEGTDQREHLPPPLRQIGVLRRRRPDIRIDDPIRR